MVRIWHRPWYRKAIYARLTRLARHLPSGCRAFLINAASAAVLLHRSLFPNRDVADGELAPLGQQLAADGLLGLARLAPLREVLLM
jgi:hypothetical protein